MWNQLAQYRNHFLQKEIKSTMTPESINSLQEKEWSLAMIQRDACRTPYDNCQRSTYFDDRTQLAYGWFALPKLMREVDSQSRQQHWRALNSLSEFLLNPLHCERAIREMEIVRKMQNAFLRLRFKLHKEEYNELDKILDIFNIISRTLIGAEEMSRRKPIIEQLYALLGKSEDKLKHCKSAEILRNLSSKPEVLAILFENPSNFQMAAQLFLEDPCQPHYPTHLWYHLTHYIEWSPERAIELGLFECLEKRIRGRLAGYYDMNMKAFALTLRCVDGQRRFDNIDGIRLLHDIFVEDAQAAAEEAAKQSLAFEVACAKSAAAALALAECRSDYSALLASAEAAKKPPKVPKIVRITKAERVATFEYVALAFQNGLHSKRALWRSREFTTLPDYFVQLLKMNQDNPRLQLFCLRTLRELAVMPCMKRYIIGNCLCSIRTLVCLNKECECVRDEIVYWLQRDITESSDD